MVPMAKRLTTLVLVALPALVAVLYAYVSFFGNIHDSVTGILLLWLFVLVLVSLPSVPFALLRLHLDLRSHSDQKSVADLAKLMCGWLYLVALLWLVASEVVRSW